MIDIIPAELLLSIFLNNRRVSTVSCSPANLIEFTVGYLLNNGYIQSYRDINLLKICSFEGDKIISRNDISIRIDINANENKNLSPAPEGLGSFFINTKYISSSCGSIDDMVLGMDIKKIKSSLKVSSDTILKLNLLAAGCQEYKKELGGLHSAAIFNVKADMIVQMEDIGRHNCMDKVSGYMTINKIPAEDKILYTTGRLSLDAIHKISRMNIPVAVTNSSISYAAAMLSKKIRLTVIGYARGGRFNIYSYPLRIIR